jgi:hypothetical protein
VKAALRGNHLGDSSLGPYWVVAVGGLKGVCGWVSSLTFSGSKECSSLKWSLNHSRPSTWSHLGNSPNFTRKYSWAVVSGGAPAHEVCTHVHISCTVIVLPISAVANKATWKQVHTFQWIGLTQFTFLSLIMHSDFQWELLSLFNLPSPRSPVG